MRMRPIVICGLSGCTIFSHFISQTVRFSRKMIEHKTCALFLSKLLSETFLILRITERGMIKNVYWSAYKVAVIIARFQWSSNFLYKFSKNTQISNFTKICPVGAELFHVNGRTDRHDEAKRRFSQFRERLYRLLVTTLTVSLSLSLHQIIIFER